MSFACFLCTPRNFRSRKRPCCPDLDHFLLVLIATLSVHSILRIYVTGVTAIHPIYIQAVSSQTLTATCLEGPDWNCDRNSEDDDWKENMREVTSKNWKNWKSKCCIFWCESCCETSWWTECMGGCSTDTEISLAETCGVALVSATLSASNQAVEGSPWCLDLRTKNLWFDANFWCEGHFWCDWIGAWLPLQARISQIS